VISQLTCVTLKLSCNNFQGKRSHPQSCISLLLFIPYVLQFLTPNPSLLLIVADRFIWNSYPWANVQCSFYYIDILIKAFLMIFQRFLKILQNLSEVHTNIAKHFLKVSEDYRRFLKTAEDSRGLSKKTTRCFNQTPMNLTSI